MIVRIGKIGNLGSKSKQGEEPSPDVPRLSVAPNYLFLNESNNNTADCFVFSNVEWSAG